jgi:D-inositol-3-phosphate glycosyltransferase
MSSRIAMISDHASPLGCLGGADGGGQNVYVAHVAKNLAALGHKVDVFTRRDSPDQPEILNWIDGVRVVHVPAGPAEFVRKEELLELMPQFASYMTRFFNRRRYDLVHANFFLSGLVAMDLKQRTGTPFVMTFHALAKVRKIYQKSADQFPPERTAIEDEIVRQAERIIAECPQDEEDLLTLYNAHPEKISIIPCGFDPAEMYPIDRMAARRWLELPEGKIILQLGRMVKRKGVDTLVRSVARLVREQRIDAKLVIVGGETREPDPEKTPELGRLMSIARELGISDNCIFIGNRNRNELRYFYSAADVFVSVPWYEPFGITPLEAMACGVPVIGADVGGIKYTVAHGKTGYLVPPKDDVALADRLGRLCRDEETRRLFAQNGIERVHRHFTWTKVARRIDDVFANVVGDRVPSRPVAGIQPAVWSDSSGAI